MAIIEDNDDNHQPKASCIQYVRRRKHYRTTLPTEIIVEILLKLPVESLLRCKSVCKSWFSLISDTRFVKSHLNLSAHNSRVIFNLGYGSVVSTCCLNDVIMAAGNLINNNAIEVDYPLKGTCREVRVVGSCNGLLCLRIRTKSSDILSIWNPSIKKYYKLPSDCYRSNSYTFFYGFGYDESTDDYKVVSSYFKVKNKKTELLVRIYSLRNGGWKDIGAFPHGTRFDLFGKFLNGSLHWAAGDGDEHWKLISLDLVTETFGEVMMPPLYDEGDRRLTLGTLGEWLCVVCDYCDDCVDLWAMKVYGVKDSWTKLVSVPYTTDGDDIDEPILDPLCISNDGKILFTFGTKLTIYDSHKSSFSDVQNFDKDVLASTFFESLVSPMPPTAALEHRAAGSNG